MLRMNALTLMLSSMLLSQCALDADTVRFAYKHWMLCMLMLWLMFCALAIDTLSIDIDAECTDVNFEFIGCWRFVYCLKMLCTLILMLFAVVAVTAFIVCWLMPPALIFDWFMFQYWAGADPFVPFVAEYFDELVSSFSLTPTSCHSARRVYPELQKPLFHKAKETLLPRGRRCSKGEWGGE